VRAVYRALGAAGGIAILSACTSGQSAIQPPSTAVNVQNTTSLQFRVGTARHANGSVYLNTVATYRQANGLSGTLYNTPTITGPAGFVVPAAQTTSTSVGAQPGTDAGTNHISATPPTQPGTAAVATIFNQTGGIFSYGFAPANSTTGGGANYPTNSLAAAANNALYIDNTSAIIVGAGKGNTVATITGGGIGGYAAVYNQPLLITTASRLPFMLGPPAVPDFHSPNFPAGFKGYDSGFIMFGVAPVAGVYALHMTVPAATIGTLAAVFDVSATLTTITPLPVVTQPAIVHGATTAAVCPNPAGSGAPVPGGGASFTVLPAAAGVTNQVLYVVDVSALTGVPTHYSFNVPAAGGSFALAATVGFNGAETFCVGDSVYAWVVGADYDVVAGAAPNNASQNPTLPAQADISVSTINEIAY
jgi:hypothetical protein